MYIIEVYRPDYNLEEALQTLGTLLDTILTWKNTVILMGDINVNSLNQIAPKYSKIFLVPTTLQDSPFHQPGSLQKAKPP